MGVPWGRASVWGSEEVLERDGAAGCTTRECTPCTTRLKMVTMVQVCFVHFITMKERKTCSQGLRTSSRKMSALFPFLICFFTLPSPPPYTHESKARLRVSGLPCEGASAADGNPELRRGLDTPRACPFIRAPPPPRDLTPTQGSDHGEAAFT